MNTQQLITELERDEEIRLKPYYDNAKPPRLTIGIGRNLSDRGITRQEAYHLLNNDIELVQADLDQHLPFWRKLDDARQRVLANMCFNMGIGNLLLFKRMLGHLMMDEYGAAADEMGQSLWVKQVGTRADRLVRMMREGGV